MADKKRIVVLCWGACEYTGEPCEIKWAPDRHVFEGDLVDDYPPAAIADDMAYGLIAWYDHDKHDDMRRQFRLKWKDREGD